ncbi:substrate-binding domain-containing protein [Streptomyces bluensis]|uniref:substrate-binding domain-containing protein n=1 Tax=Streptomyces bluensis TaxID=33897 RepID=UPI00331F9C63
MPPTGAAATAPPRPRRPCPCPARRPDRGGRRRGRAHPPRRRPPATSVVAFNDRCATGVLDAFLRARVPVPDEISVVGFDDSHLARLAHIDLTTVGQDIRRLADLAVGRAVARLEDEVTSDGDTSGEETVIAPHLVTRSTTAPPHDTP